MVYDWVCLIGASNSSPNEAAEALQWHISQNPSTLPPIRQSLGHEPAKWEGNRWLLLDWLMKKWLSSGCQKTRWAKDGRTWEQDFKRCPVSFWVPQSQILVTLESIMNTSKVLQLWAGSTHPLLTCSGNESRLQNEKKMRVNTYNSPCWIPWNAARQRDFPRLFLHHVQNKGVDILWFLRRHQVHGLNRGIAKTHLGMQGATKDFKFDIQRFYEIFNYVYIYIVCIS